MPDALGNPTAYEIARKQKWQDDRSGAGEWLFGGGATSGMAEGPQTAKYQRTYLDSMLNRQAPQMNAGQSDQSRAQQSQLAQMLMQQANGQKAGAGEMAVNRQVGQANAQQTAQASMARGANASLAMRNAARNQADIGVNGAGQAAIAQANDQTNARNQLGGLLGQTRQQDIGVAQGNQAAQMQQQQLQISALAQMLGVDEATLKEDLAKRQLGMQDKGSFGDIMQAGGGLMAMFCDENLKTDIIDASNEIDVMLFQIDPKRYRYRDEEKHGEGSRVGVMAQDLARSQAGKDAVFYHEGVLRIDVHKALGLALAAVARLDARVRELEGK